MADNFIDLHMHSVYSSDGEFSPTELVEMCYKKEITIMAIADHNSVEATEEARRAAALYGIHYINAIEIDCVYRHSNLHVLGYGIDYKKKAFKELRENISCQEKAAAERRIELTSNLGFTVNRRELDKISKDGIYTGEMFAEVLLCNSDYKESELLRPYRQGGVRGDNPYTNFYWDYYAKGKPCYVEIKFPELEEAIKIIKESGGVPVLAHPGQSLQEKDKKRFQEIVSAGIQGIEVYSSYHSIHTASEYLQMAKKFKLIITCGSDFHGKVKPAIHIGETGCRIEQTEIQEELKRRGIL